MERNCLLLLLNSSNLLHLFCEVHPCVYKERKVAVNEQMWMRVREPLHTVEKGVLRSGTGLGKSVEQLLLNSFSFDASCNHIWF